MYHKYHTEAVVVGSREHGESDRIFALFTREFGLVRARAGAVRSEKSKMRYALQSGSHIDISLIRGKRGWRAAGALVNAETLSVPGTATFMRISQLVLRFVLGEEKNEYLFETLLSARTALTSTTREEASAVELVCVARVLYSLGYLSAGALSTALFAHTALTVEHLKEVEEKRSEILSHINNALSESQL